MEYSPPPFFRRGPSLATRLIFFSLLSLVLLFVDARFNYLEHVRRGLAVVIYPFQQLTNLPGDISRAIGDFFVTQATLRRENEKLKGENFVNAGVLQTHQSLLVENENLRALLEMRPRVDPGAQVAEILYMSRDPFVRKVAIDKGSSSGVKSGAAVIDARGLVGQVHRVFPWAAEVALITDREQVIPVQVVRNGLRAVVFGLGYDGALEVRFMPTNADIEETDVLVTSGIDGVYPAGLPVATVVSIERNPAYPFARIMCIPASGVGKHRQMMILSRAEGYPERPPSAGRPMIAPRPKKKAP